MLNLPSLDLEDIEEDITEEELKATIFSMPAEKAPGPDGFIGAFYKAAWEIIKEDLLKAVISFFNRNTLQLRDLNSTFICLLPKKDDANGAEHYRPISLIHSLSKIISKLLANRLAPELPELVSPNQSAFIRKRAIHDNFLYVQNMVKFLHKSKKQSLFFKVDIAKAFDTVCWPYLLEVMRYFGFGTQSLNWISNLLATSTSQILLNGVPGPSIAHVRGLRQGDPLLPMLFILAMEPFHRIVKAAESASLLSPIGGRFDRFRCSLYADDVALFMKPEPNDLLALLQLLSFFAQASGLHTNVSKTEIYPISWKDEGKPWTGMPVPCDETDRRLFQAATSITLGNGEKTSIWHDNWLQKCCPKDIAPSCFRLAKRKQRKVQVELVGNKWLASFRQFSTVKEIHELVHLGSLLQDVNLSAIPDDISWKWNEVGIYTSKSAYLFQFEGSFASINFSSIWKAPAEPKTSVQILCEESRGDSRASDIVDCHNTITFQVQISTEISGLISRCEYGSVCKTVACAKGGMREGDPHAGEGVIGVKVRHCSRRTSVTSTADCAESPRSVRIHIPLLLKWIEI
uniref:OSJNBa0050F15.5 protein n=1 Tax=Oryza sativa subsp. japonica TaxID=39947 RepID=Q7XVQ0_ORYSJ|nr:OSJNBa0050F15.5 [Oryza sativa Japonica Group]